MSYQFKIGSLFDGSGGFPLAAALCGGIPTWASEVEPYPIAVTRSRFPQMKHLGDISKINGAEIEPVDVVSFGSPCQGLSQAGLRMGLDDERSGLFLEAIRVIKEMWEATNGKYPSFALWENVPGAFSSNNGDDFRVVLEELIKIVEPSATVPAPDKNGWPYADCYVGAGWSLAYRVFDAQFWGVPQRRRRIHLVLDLRGERAEKVLFEREGLRGYFAEGRTPWQAVTADAQGSPGAADRAEVVGSVGFPLGFRPENVRCYDEVATTICNGTRPGFTCGVIQPVAYSFDSLASNSMKSSNPHSGCRQVEVAKTLDTTDPNPCKNQGGIAVVEQYLFENHSQDTRYKGPLDVCPMLPAQLGTGGNNTPFVVEEHGDIYCIDGDKIGKAERSGGSGLGIRPGDKMYTLTAKDVHGVCIPINDKATRYKGGGSSRNHDGSGNGLGVGADGDPSPTLTAGDRHAVVYAIDQQGGKGGANYAKDVMPTICSDSHGTPHAVAYSIGNGQLNQIGMSEVCNTLDCMHDKQAVLVGEAHGIDCRNMNEYEELYPTLQAKPNGGQSLNFSGAVRVRYIVRRLTPIECARLQGFADWWGEIDEKKDFTDEEYQFWLDVRNTHAAINDKAQKEYTKQQMLTWYNKLLTDSSEYKMWGNGIALPPALYCMQGIVDALSAYEEVRGA